MDLFEYKLGNKKKKRTKKHSVNAVYDNKRKQTHKINGGR